MAHVSIIQAHSKRNKYSYAMGALNDMFVRDRAVFVMFRARWTRPTLVLQIERESEQITRVFTSGHGQPMTLTA